MFYFGQEKCILNFLKYINNNNATINNTNHLLKSTFAC